MKDQKVFIHVGLPKTASTLLQEIVFPALKPMTYISRPYTQENHAFNKLQYADDSLYAAEELRDEIDNIIALEPGNKVLISDELLSGAPFYNFINRGLIAKRLAEILPHAEVILFLRGQKDIIRSLYNQYVKIGWFTDELNSRFISFPGHGFELNAFVKGKRDWNIHNRFINHQSFMNQCHFLFYELVKLYDDNFSKVHLFLYEDLLTRPETVLSRLEELFEAKLPETVLQRVKTTNVNPKLSEDAIAARLVRDRLKLLFPSGKHKLIRKALGGFLAFMMRENGFVERGERHLAQVVNPVLFGKNNIKLVERYPDVGITRYPESYFLKK
jgi:Sulfotransferase domain